MGYRRMQKRLKRAKQAIHRLTIAVIVLAVAIPLAGATTWFVGYRSGVRAERIETKLAERFVEEFGPTPRSTRPPLSLAILNAVVMERHAELKRAYMSGREFPPLYASNADIMWAANKGHWERKALEASR